MVYLSKDGSEISFESGMIPSRLLIMAGKPLEQTVIQHGPFVMNTEEEIRQAWTDFRSGKMGELV